MADEHTRSLQNPKLACYITRLMIRGNSSTVRTTGKSKDQGIQKVDNRKSETGKHGTSVTIIEFLFYVFRVYVINVGLLLHLLIYFKLIES